MFHFVLLRVTAYLCLIRALETTVFSKAFSKTPATMKVLTWLTATTHTAVVLERGVIGSISSMRLTHCGARGASKRRGGKVIGHADVCDVMLLYTQHTETQRRRGKKEEEEEEEEE